jgi:serine/threonine-protein kinase
MSPEQILGKKVERSSDIFSLGVTLYQLLSGELPFKGDNIAELSRHILQSKPGNIRDLCPGLSAAVRRIINKTLQKEPGDRYRDAAELASALRQAN